MKVWLGLIILFVLFLFLFPLFHTGMYLSHDGGAHVTDIISLVTLCGIIVFFMVTLLYNKGGLHI